MRGSSVSHVVDSFDIGWYVESADEDIYGPLSRETIERLLKEGKISANTLVRHCTQPEATPLAEQPSLKPCLEHAGPNSAVGDSMADAWPRGSRERAELAEGQETCTLHDRPAELICVRCLSPYCRRCRMKPYKKQFYFCRKCQSSNANRRFFAYLIDTFMYILLPIAFVMPAILMVLGPEHPSLGLAGNLLQLFTLAAFVFRDSMWKGSGMGKRMLGLKVVQVADGETPLKHTQAILRYLAHLIPLFNLFDASAMYSNPQTRRYGDRWAGTRVIDTDKRLMKDRQKAFEQALKKGIQLPDSVGITIPELARIA